MSSHHSGLAEAPDTALDSGLRRNDGVKIHKAEHRISFPNHVTPAKAGAQPALKLGGVSDTTLDSGLCGNDIVKCRTARQYKRWTSLRLGISKRKGYLHDIAQRSRYAVLSLSEFHSIRVSVSA